MKFYNSLTKQIEDFNSIEKGKVKIYACGPTVYSRAHLGNLYSYIHQDLIVKSLRFLEYEVTHVMNITDVGHLTGDNDYGDDKMDEASKKEKKTPQEIASFYETKFFEDCKKLNIAKPTKTPRATECIQDIIEFIQELEKKGFTYQEDNLYFSIDEFEKRGNVYGKMSNLFNSKDFQNRVSNDAKKRNPKDFVLWFTNSKYKQHLQNWDSPWGTGYPGWHIECSAMSYKELGEKFDIHFGGIDHESLHHPNEMAQSEARFNHPFVNYFIHVHFLNFLGDKMSKSSGEVLTLDDIEAAGFDPLLFRWFAISKNYRKDADFNIKVFEKISSQYQNYLVFCARYLDLDIDLSSLSFRDLSNEGLRVLSEFKSYLADDFNTLSALSLVTVICTNTRMSQKERTFLISKIEEVLSLSLIENARKIIYHPSSEDKAQLALRNEAKAKGNYKVADKIRDSFKNVGIEILDTKDGACILLKKKI